MLCAVHTSSSKCTLMCIVVATDSDGIVGAPDGHRAVARLGIFPLNIEKCSRCFSRSFAWLEGYGVNVRLHSGTTHLSAISRQTPEQVL